jgi:hypothetical protein
MRLWRRIVPLTLNAVRPVDPSVAHLNQHMLRPRLWNGAALNAQNLWSAWIVKSNGVHLCWNGLSHCRLFPLNNTQQKLVTSPASGKPHAAAPYYRALTLCKLGRL